MFAGVYENSRENIEALLSLTRPKSAAMSSLPAEGASVLKAGCEKKPRTCDGSGLLGLPNLLLIEVLTRCTGEIRRPFSCAFRSVSFRLMSLVPAPRFHPLELHLPDVDTVHHDSPCKEQGL
jgi:hypothetical protein